jgi:hypothetical protein
MYTLNQVVTGNNKLRYNKHKRNTFMLTLGFIIRNILQ